jgi:hypothetical protein
VPIVDVAGGRIVVAENPFADESNER